MERCVPSAETSDESSDASMPVRAEGEGIIHVLRYLQGSSGSFLMRLQKRTTA